MLIIMLHPHFKFLQAGCGDAIYFAFDYDVRMVYVFFDQINIILACARHNNKLTIQIQEDSLIICLVLEHLCLVFMGRNIIK